MIAPVTLDDIVGLVTGVGFPITLFIFMAWFISARVWPWYTQRVAANDKMYSDRHDGYMQQIKASNSAMESIAEVLTEMAAGMNGKFDTILKKLEDIDRTLRG